MAGQFVIKQIAQEVISEVNQPLYIGGIDPLGSDSKLTIASNGNVSTTTPLTVPSLTVNSKPVMSSLLASYTVTGSAVTSIDFSGLDINTHKSYAIELEFINATASDSNIRMFINGDTTVNNYWNQQLQGSGTAVTAARFNVSEVLWIQGSHHGCSKVFLNRVNGYPRFESISNISTPSSPTNLVYVGTKSTSVTNITQLTFTASVANSIGVGSTIRIYRGDV